VFLSSGVRLCPSCRDADRREFEAVRDYLRDHPQACLMAVSQATGIPLARIREFLREGRLVVAAPEAELACERCGAPITTGRLCERCRQELARELGEGRPGPAGRGGATREPPAARRAQWHLGNRDRRREG